MVTHQTIQALEDRVKKLEHLLNQKNTMPIDNDLQQYPRVITTVDVLPLIKIMGVQFVLLGRKPNQDAFRLIGGFCEAGSRASEEDALRELEEEAGIKASNAKKFLRYVGSMNIESSKVTPPDVLRTSLYVVDFQKTPSRYWINATAGDDIWEIKWVNISGGPNFVLDPDTRNPIDIVPEHKKLLELAIAYITDVLKDDGKFSKDSQDIQGFIDYIERQERRI